MLLFAGTVIYMFWQVLSLPFIGFANSYDFLRQSSCVGLWQSIDGVDKTLGNYLFPGSQLLFDGDRREELCMRSVDNFFPWLATLFHEPGDRLGFWQVAASKLLLLSVATGVLLQSAGRLRLPLCAVFVLLFTDWVYLGYANTLYLEFSVVMAAFVALAGGCCLLAGMQRPGRMLLWLIVLALAWLALSKQQYAPLAVVLGWLFAAVVWLRWRAALAATVLAGAGVIGMSVFMLLNPPGSELMRTIDQVNKTNTYLGAVLPAAADPQAALRQLGLPEQCLEAVGSNWYSIEGSRPCPAVVDVSRSQLPGLFIDQPRTLVVPLYRIALGVRPLYPDYLGVTEPHAEAAGARKLAFVRSVSFSTWVSSLPEWAYMLMVCMSLLGGALALPGLLMSYRSVSVVGEGQRARLALMLLGGGAGLYALFSSVFGDGYIEMAKHAVIFGVGLVFQCVAVGWWALCGLRKSLLTSGTCMGAR